MACANLGDERNEALAGTLYQLHKSLIGVVRALVSDGVRLLYIIALYDSLGFV